MNNKYIITVFTITAGLVLAGVFLWRIFLALPAYDIAIVQTGKAIEAIYATAVVEPVSWSAISPVRTGRIVEINVEEGDVVNESDVLARLDDADLRAHLREEQALAGLYKENLDRAEELLRNSSIAQKEYDQRHADYTRSQARISMLEEQIRQLSLSTPMDGTVLWRDVELGEVKEAGKPLFWVGLPRPLRLEAEVDEEDIPKIRKGQNVLITADAYPDKVMEGTVDWISPKGDPVTKSYRVYMGLPDDTLLMIGMTVETNTITQEKDETLLVPVEALSGGKYLWHVTRENGKVHVHKISVETGIIGEEKVEIVGGVKAGDRVILPPFAGLEDGMEIQVR